MNDENVLFPELDADIQHFGELYPDLNISMESEYYDMTKINALTVTDTDFSIFSHNCRSLHGHFDELSALLNSINFKFDVISFTESWLNDGIKNLVSFHGYKAYHSLRPNSSYGGISVFVKDKFTVKVIPNTCISLDTIECLGLTLCNNNHRINVITIYKPNTSKSLFTEKCMEVLSTVGVRGAGELYVCGDFNIDLLQCENDDDTQHFLTLFQSLSLLPVISKPTRITDTTATLIDHIYVANPYKVQPGIIVDNISDHMPTFMIRTDLFRACPSNSNLTIKYRIINENSLRCIYNQINSIDLLILTESNDCTTGLKELLRIIQVAYEHHCPVRTKIRSHKSLQKPWITHDIISNIKKKRAYYILYQQNKILRDFFVQF